MKDKLKLGILVKDGKVVNHRSFIKVIFNPILRRFGYCIATEMDTDLRGIILIKCEKHKIEWDFNNHNDFDYIIKKRRFI